MTNLVRNLKEDVIKSGLTTEIEVSNMLRQDNWIVINQYPYIDERVEKIRTLDVLATKALKGGKSCTLFVECKKATDHQWIFYTPPLTGMDLFLRVMDNLTRQIERQHIPEQNHRATAPFFSVHPPDLSTSRIGLISYIPFSKKDDFNEARNQILSAIESRRLTASERSVVYPVIVFDGDLYELDVAGDDIELTTASYLTFLSSMITDLTPILIDITTLRHFPSYVDMLNKELGPARSPSEAIEAIQELIERLSGKQ